MRKPNIIIITICILSLPIIGIYQCTKEFSEWNESLDGIRDPSEYLASYAEWKEAKPESIEHFPSSIQDPTFYYFFRRGFLQGGASFHLGLQLTEYEFESLGEIVARKGYLEKDDDFPKPGFYPINAHGNYVDWTRDYTYKYLGAKNTSGLDYWNHGYIYGIAFSKNGTKVIYFAESW